MTLNDGAGTMARDGGHAVRPPIASVDAELDHVYYFALFPTPRLAAPRLRMLHPLAARAGAHDVVCEWLFEPETIAAPGFDANDAIDFWDQVNREDWHVCELAQKGVGSRGYVAGRYSTHEGDVHSFDDGGQPLPGGAAVNKIAAALGEVGLPEPIERLAARDWDAIVVGGGHNGLTAAAYLPVPSAASSCSSGASAWGERRR